MNLGVDFIDFTVKTDNIMFNHNQFQTTWIFLISLFRYIQYIQWSTHVNRCKFLLNNCYQKNYELRLMQYLYSIARQNKIKCNNRTFKHKGTTQLFSSSPSPSSPLKFSSFEYGTAVAPSIIHLQLKPLNWFFEEDRKWIDAKFVVDVILYGFFKFAP